MGQEIVSIRTRQVFRENMVGWVLREIRDEFDEARVDCDLSYQPSESGQRRVLVEQYFRTVDWTSSTQVKRVIQVFESVIRRAEKLAAEATFAPEVQGQRKKELEKLILFLQKDGFQWVDGRIATGVAIPSLADIKETATAFDAKHMSEQIRRMESSVDSDPSLAIGTAKELIETCCKTILAARGMPVVGTPDVPTLTKNTLKALKLVPEGIPAAARGAEVIKRLLSNLGTIGNGLAELRGLYGTGHGQHGSVTGLSARHAKLAVGAASTLVIFLFQTHMETKS